MPIDSNDRLSRPERRALQREDERLIALPLGVRGDLQSMRSAEAHVRHIVKLLRGDPAASPCTEATRYVGELLDRTVTEAANKMIACRRGCSYCCCQLVSLSAPEVFALAAHVRARPKVAAAVRETDRATRGLSLEERLQRRVLCPLLEETLCSVYAIRPLGCHGFVSVNLDACLAAFVHGRTPEIPQPQSTITVLQACRIVLMAALRLIQRPEHVYELNAALALALEAEDSEQRWLAGSDVLANAALPPSVPPPIAAVIGRIAVQIAPTI